MTQHTSDLVPRTPEEAFCFAAAQVLSRWEINEVLTHMALLPIGDLDRNALMDLVAAMQAQASIRAWRAPDPVAEIREVIRSPATRYRVKRFLEEALDADPVDTVSDTEQLRRLLSARLDGLIGRRG